MRRSPKIKAVIAAFMWAEELAWTFAFLQKLLNKFTPSLTQAPVRSLEKRRHVQQYIRFFNSPPVWQLHFSYFATLNRRFPCLFVSINCSSLGFSLPAATIAFFSSKVFWVKEHPTKLFTAFIAFDCCCNQGRRQLSEIGGQSWKPGGGGGGAKFWR